MQQFPPLVLVVGKIDQPADRHAAAAGVVEAERIGRVLELADLPADVPLLVAVEDLNAREKAAIEGALEGVLAERPLHEVEPAAAREMLVAEGVFLVADADRAQDGDLPNLKPEVGDGGQRAGVTFRGVGLVVDIDLIDEVVFRRPVVELVHPPLDAQPAPAEGDRVGECRIEATLVWRLIARARAGREGDGIDLRTAADLDSEVLLL